MNQLFDDYVKVAFNSFESGLIDKQAAIDMVTDAMHNKCQDCNDEAIRNLDNCLSVIERAVDDEMQQMPEFPLDDISIEEVLKLHKDKNVIIHCGDGHVLGMYVQSEGGISCKSTKRSAEKAG